MQANVQRFLREEHRAAVRAAYEAWRSQRPWRWLPRSLRARVFGFLGRRFAAAYVADWKTRVRPFEGAEVLGWGAFDPVLTPRQRRRLQQTAPDPLPRAASRNEVGRIREVVRFDERSLPLHPPRSWLWLFG